MNEYISTLALTILYTILLNLFVGIFVSRRNISYYLFCLSQVILVLCDIVISYLFLNQVAIKQITVIFVNAIILWVIYAVKLPKAFVLIVSFQGCEIAIEYLVFVILQYIFGLKVADLLQNDVRSYILGLFCYLILFCVISVIRKSMPKKGGYLLTQMEWVRYSVFPLFSIVTILILMLRFDFVENNSQGMILIWVVSGLVIMNILIFSLLSDALKRENELAEFRVIQERGKSDTEMYRSMIKQYDEQRKMVHEFKNHMLCIVSLAKHEETEKLNDYISKIQDNMNEEHDLIDTNHKIINRILNAKYLEACQKKILLVIKANDLSEIVMEDQDVVVLLSNILNNAIEACEQCEKKVIKLKMLKERDWLTVSVSNSYEQEPIVQAGKFITRKTENVQYHGLGIENIKDVVEKYKGTYHIKHENNQFQFSVLLPMNSQNK